MSGGFESSVAGALNDDAVLECGVCWRVYDPTEGDETWDIAPGTPFSQLPAHWRCPSCDAPPSKFMVRDAGEMLAVAADTSLEARVAALIGAYEAAESSMLGLPVHNGALRVEAVGFRPVEAGYAGVIITPWCMNIAVLATDPKAAPAGPLGSTRTHAFPSGRYSFTIGRMDGVGVVETCSLFSPMDEFDDPAVARMTAESAVEGLFTAEAPPAPKKPAGVTRRFILTTNRAEA